ncbi:TRAF-like family protein [Citrus sinensis]|uniref:TRAF-like family protein n=1 Tax=Citrus sinensis TaxID=2711 RepID=A0ACB8KG87_CITSI|nr:TRAF-like family protein [Citrus sinensis]
MADSSSFGSGWEVFVIFRLFVHDQNEDTYLIPQDAMGNERRFHGLKLEWGFDQFIPLKEFNDASNGYLVGDTCIFGAEVFVKERNIVKGECLSMKKFTSASPYKKIQLYPKGHRVASGSHISMYLELADLSTITRGFKIYVHFTLRIRNQVQSIHNHYKTASDWFRTSIDNWGWHKFIELSYLNKAGNGFLVNDVCIVEAEVSVLGISEAL